MRLGKIELSFNVSVIRPRRAASLCGCGCCAAADGFICGKVRARQEELMLPRNVYTCSLSRDEAERVKLKVFYSSIAQLGYASIRNANDDGGEREQLVKYSNMKTKLKRANSYFHISYQEDIEDLYGSSNLYLSSLNPEIGYNFL